MPKRVIDFDALWASDKLAACAEWAQSEYAWLYGLADASGSFEFTNLRVIWGRVAAIRKNLSLERLQEIFDEFIARGLLFSWEENGKRYGHWTGSDIPGRLPARSWRVRLQKLAPPVPAEALAAYSARFGGSKEGIVLRAANDASDAACCENEREDAHETGLKQDVEEAQAQDWDLGLDSEKDLEKQVCPAPRQAQNRRLPGTPRQQFNATGTAAKTGGRTHEIRPANTGVGENMAAAATAEELLEIYEGERGELPPAGVLTAERRRRCARWLAGGFTAEQFRAVVRGAAATPFLVGEGSRGWQADFDWLIANRSNARKVLAGEYAPRASARAASERTRAGRSRAPRHVPADLYTGIGPRPAECGVRVNPAALERIRARQARMRGSAGFADPPETPAPHAVACGPYDRVAHETPSQPIAFDAQPRASPEVLES
jgi:hypothetical protein